MLFRKIDSLGGCTLANQVPHQADSTKADHDEHGDKSSPVLSIVLSGCILAVEVACTNLGVDILIGKRCLHFVGSVNTIVATWKGVVLGQLIDEVSWAKIVFNRGLLKKLHVTLVVEVGESDIIAVHTPVLAVRVQLGVVRDVRAVVSVC